MPDLPPFQRWLDTVTTDKVVVRTEDLRALVVAAGQGAMPEAPSLIGDRS